MKPESLDELKQTVPESVESVNSSIFHYKSGKDSKGTKNEGDLKKTCTMFPKKCCKTCKGVEIDTDGRLL